MANPLPSLLHHVRRMAASSCTDEQLLADFVARRGEESFAALMDRHGPLVLNVCRRILQDGHAAEDIFQATFLVLARRAEMIRHKTSLAGFLHGIATRLAVRARRRARRQPPPVKPEPSAPSADQTAWNEVLSILDRELGQLPDRYRTPLVLCYLQGRTRDEAARELRCSINTLRRRIDRGRALLQARLVGRGVSLSAALGGLLLTGTAPVPPALQAATLASIPSRLAGLSLMSLLGFGAGILFTLTCTFVAVSFVWPTDQPSPMPAAAPLLRPTILGTQRYRNGNLIGTMAVSAEGHLAIVASNWRDLSPARVFDLRDGRCVLSLPVEDNHGHEAVGISPDGKILATKDNHLIRMWDAATGRLIRAFRYLPNTGGGRSVTDWLTFSPDGRTLAVTQMEHAVQLMDTETGKILQTLNPSAAASACVFSPDGKWLATAGYDKVDGVYLARLWDVATGKEIKRFPAGDFPGGNGRKRSLAFSPDGKFLASGGWGDARIRRWEVATGKEPITYPKLAEDLNSVAYSPEGTTLVAAAAQLHFLEVATGKERRRVDRAARFVTFSRDGKTVTGAVGGAIDRWEAGTGKQLTPTVAQNSGVEQLLVADDQVMSLDWEGNLYAWSDKADAPPQRLATDARRGVIASRDGRWLAWTTKHIHGGSQVRLYDRQTRRYRDHFPVMGDISSVEAFLPDGKSLITVDRGVMRVRIWDVESGKERRSFAVYDGKEPLSGVTESPFAVRRIALSPDGHILAIGQMDMRRNVELWDVNTGKRLHQLDVQLTSVHQALSNLLLIDFLGRGRPLVPGFMSSGNGLTFSADGNFLLTWWENPFQADATNHATIWDVSSGQAVTQLKLKDRAIGVSCATFAPDGRTLATASRDGTIHIWEVTTWQLRSEHRGHRDRITAMTHSADGRLLTGGLDTTILSWPTRPQPAKKEGTLAVAWTTLSQLDARQGFQAQGRFLAEPAAAVRWLASRLTPAVAPPEAKVKEWIADLDSDDFEVRDRAGTALKEYWPLTAPEVREVIRRGSSLEAKRRAKGILREMNQGMSLTTLRDVRAIEILEAIGTPEARAVLAPLARGAPRARLTKEAQAALDRLQGRKSVGEE